MHDQGTYLTPALNTWGQRHAGLQRLYGRHDPVLQQIPVKGETKTFRSHINTCKSTVLGADSKKKLRNKRRIQRRLNAARIPAGW